MKNRKELLVSCAAILVVLTLGSWADTCFGEEVAAELRARLLAGARDYQQPFEDGVVDTEGILMMDAEVLHGAGGPAPALIPTHLTTHFKAKYGNGRIYVWKEGFLNGQRKVVETGWNGSVFREVYFDDRKPVKATQACTEPKSRFLTEDKYLALVIAFGAYDGDKQCLSQQDTTWLQDILQNAQNIDAEPSMPNTYRVQYSAPPASFIALVSDKPVVHCIMYQRDIARHDRITRQRCEIVYGHRGKHWMPMKATRSISYISGEATESPVVDVVNYTRLTLRKGVADSEFLLQIPKGIPIRDLCKDPIPELSQSNRPGIGTGSDRIGPSGSRWLYVVGVAVFGACVPWSAASRPRCRSTPPR